MLYSLVYIDSEFLFGFSEFRFIRETVALELRFLSIEVKAYLSTSSGAYVLISGSVD